MYVCMYVCMYSFALASRWSWRAPLCRTTCTKPFVCCTSCSRECSTPARPSTRHSSWTSRRCRWTGAMPLLYMYCIHNTCLWINTHIHVYTIHHSLNTANPYHTHIHTFCTYIHTYIQHSYILYIHTYILYIHTYIHTYIHAYIHTYILTHMHTYIHTHIHTYTTTTILPLILITLYYH